MMFIMVFGTRLKLMNSMLKPSLNNPRHLLLKTISTVQQTNQVTIKYYSLYRKSFKHHFTFDIKGFK